MSVLTDEIRRLAFARFARLHPHEAAELDWERFCEFVRKECGNPDLSDEEIRAIAAQTEG